MFSALRLYVALAFVVGVVGSSHADDESSLLHLELERALQISEQIKSAQKAYLSAKENIIIANVSSEWSATLSTDKNWQERASNGGEFEESESNDVTLELKKKLYDGGVSSRSEDVAELQLQRAAMQRAVAEENVLLEAVRTYIALSEARERLMISQSNLARFDEHLRATTLRLSIGIGTVTELAGTKSRHAQAKATLIQAENNLATAEARYVSLIGDPPSNIVMDDEAMIALPTTATQAADSALSGKPSHLIVLFQERIARRTIDSLIAQTRPNLDLTLSGRSTDSSIPQSDREVGSVTLRFSVPLYPSPSVRAKSRGAIADHQKSLHDLTDNRRITRLEAETAYRTHQNATAIIEAHLAEQEAALTLRDGTAREFEFGQKTILDLLDAEQDLLNAELNLLTARHDAVMSAYTLLSSAGMLSAQKLGLSTAGLYEDGTATGVLAVPFLILNYDE